MLTGSSVEVVAFPGEHHSAHWAASHDSVAEQAVVAARVAVAIKSESALRTALDEMIEMAEHRPRAGLAATQPLA
jgi:hypothetical protein